MPQGEDFSRRRSPPDLIRALGQLAREDAESLGSSVMPLLSHPEPGVRSETLSAVFVLWRMREHREIAKKMLEFDRHAEVRARAAFAIVATADQESRRGDALLLLKTTENDCEDAEVRRAAYEGLLLLFDRSDFPDAVDKFVPLDDIDWEWIASLRLTLN